jgi:hypothetical protein
MKDTGLPTRKKPLLKKQLASSKTFIRRLLANSTADADFPHTKAIFSSRAEDSHRCNLLAEKLRDVIF